MTTMRPLTQLQRRALEHPLWQAGQFTPEHTTLMSLAGHQVGVGLSVNK